MSRKTCPWASSWRVIASGKRIEALAWCLKRANKVGFDATLDTALALAKLREQIRGFWHIKKESVVGVRVRWKVLMQPLQTPSVVVKREPLPA